MERKQGYLILRIVLVCIALIRLATTCNNRTRYPAVNNTEPIRTEISPEPQQPWSGVEMAEIYVTVKQMSAKIFKQEKAQEEMTGCVIQKLKERYPKGVASDTATLNGAYKGIGKECVEQVQKKISQRMDAQGRAAN